MSIKFLNRGINVSIASRNENQQNVINAFFISTSNRNTLIIDLNKTFLNPALRSQISQHATYVDQTPDNITNYILSNLTDYDAICVSGLQNYAIKNRNFSIHTLCTGLFDAVNSRSKIILFLYNKSVIDVKNMQRLPEEINILSSVASFLYNGDTDTIIKDSMPLDKFDKTKEDLLVEAFRTGYLLSESFHTNKEEVILDIEDQFLRKLIESLKVPKIGSRKIKINNESGISKLSFESLDQPTSDFELVAVKTKEGWNVIKVPMPLQDWSVEHLFNNLRDAVVAYCGLNFWVEEIYEVRLLGTDFLGEDLVYSYAEKILCEYMLKYYGEVSLDRLEAYFDYILDKGSFSVNHPDLGEGWINTQDFQKLLDKMRICCRKIDESLSYPTTAINKIREIVERNS